MSDIHDDFDPSDYESGPFCKHFSDPSDCDELCKCEHLCKEHDYDGYCTVEDCPCEKFEDKR